MNRLITTFDEVPPYLLNAIHIANNDGVTFKTCTAEVFRPASLPESRSSQVIETRKDSAVHVSLSSSSLVKQPGFENPSPIAGSFPSLELFRRPHSTANDNRLSSAVDSLILVRSLRARQLALALGQDSAALSGRFISLPNRRCQRLLSTNRRIIDAEFRTAGSLDI